MLALLFIIIVRLRRTDVRSRVVSVGVLSSIRNKVKSGLSCIFNAFVSFKVHFLEDTHTHHTRVAASLGRISKIRIVLFDFKCTKSLTRFRVGSDTILKKKERKIEKKNYYFSIIPSGCLADTCCYDLASGPNPGGNGCGGCVVPHFFSSSYTKYFRIDACSF